MFKISSLADYASVIMNDLCAHENLLQSASAVADRIELPVTTVSKVLKQLQAADLVLSQRGAQGGYTLALPPEEIPLTRVIAAIDGEPELVRCSAARCQRYEACQVRHNWRYLSELMYRLLSNVSVRDMQGSLTDQALLGELSLAEACLHRQEGV